MRSYCVCSRKAWNRAARCIFDISEANIRHWRNDHNSIYSCKTTKCFIRPKKGRHPKIDKAVLHFVSETCAKGLPVTRQAMQLKAGETAKTLGIDETKAKATRGWCDRLMRQAGLSLRHQTLICPKLPIGFRENAVVELCFGKCCVTHALADTGAVWCGKLKTSMTVIGKVIRKNWTQNMKS